MYPQRSIQFSSVQDGIYALSKAHTHSILALSFLSTTFKTAPMFIRLIALSCPFQEDCQVCSQRKAISVVESAWNHHCRVTGRHLVPLSWFPPTWPKRTYQGVHLWWGHRPSPPTARAEGRHGQGQWSPGAAPAATHTGTVLVYVCSQQGDITQATHTGTENQSLF